MRRIDTQGFLRKYSNRMNKCVLVVLFFFTISCSKPEKVIIGTYYNFQPSLIEMLFNNVFQGINGYRCSVLSLTLFSDSTFAYVTNGSYYTGIWKCSNDSLSLYLKKGICTDFIGNNSINKLLKSRRSSAQPDFHPAIPMVFDIRGNCLIRTTDSHHHKTLEKLTYKRFEPAGYLK